MWVQNGFAREQCMVCGTDTKNLTFIWCTAWNIWKCCSFEETYPESKKIVCSQMHPGVTRRGFKSAILFQNRMSTDPHIDLSLFNDGLTKPWRCLPNLIQTASFTPCVCTVPNLSSVYDFSSVWFQQQGTNMFKCKSPVGALCQQWEHNHSDCRKWPKTKMLWIQQDFCWKQSLMPGKYCKKRHHWTFNTVLCNIRIIIPWIYLSRNLAINHLRFIPHQNIKILCRTAFTTHIHMQNVPRAYVIMQECVCMWHLHHI